MKFGVSLACALGVAPRIKAMTMRDLGMMRRLLMRTGLMMFGGFQMMMRRLTMMLCCKMVMLDRLIDL